AIPRAGCAAPLRPRGGPAGWKPASTSSRPRPAGQSARLFPAPLGRLFPVGQTRALGLQRLPALARPGQRLIVASVEDDEASFQSIRGTHFSAIDHEQRLSSIQVLARFAEQNRLAISIWLGRATVRQKTVIPPGPEMLVQRLKLVRVGHVNERLPAPLTRLFQQSWQ